MAKKDQPTDRQKWALRIALADAYASGWKIKRKSGNPPRLRVGSTRGYWGRTHSVPRPTVESLMFKGLVEWDGHSDTAELTAKGISVAEDAYLQHTGHTARSVAEKRIKEAEEKVQKEAAYEQRVRDMFAGITVSKANGKGKDALSKRIDLRGVQLSLRDLEEIGQQIEVRKR